jgi:tRNA (guanine37-N1)-methyltransferase
MHPQYSHSRESGNLKIPHQVRDDKKGMFITILTLFPTMFEGPFSSSIISRAVKKGKVTLTFVNIRDFADDKYKTVDDRPYGGGVGMVMKVDVIDRVLVYAKNLYPDMRAHTILLEAAGKLYKESNALRIAKDTQHLILIAGHYEGVDARVRQLADETFSIGEYVLTGGEIPAMVIVDSVVRLLPGVLSKDESPKDESYTKNPTYLEYPQYTKPQSYKSMDVPLILLSGNHKKIENWRKEKSIKKGSGSVL